jgi:hypothetical protein
MRAFVILVRRFICGASTICLVTSCQQQRFKDGGIRYPISTGTPHDVDLKLTPTEQSEFAKWIGGP